jgi:hypothetical protein
VADNIEWHCKQLPNGMNPIVVCERQDLLDEIERLRAAGDALAERLRWWTDDTDEAYPDHEALRTWGEVARD